MTTLDPELYSSKTEQSWVGDLKYLILSVWDTVIGD